MRGHVVACAGLLLLTGLWSAPAAPPAALAADDVQDIVFQGDKGPVLVRLHIRIDGQPFRKAYREAWRDYVEHLFRQLDHDGDGFLSAEEAALLPPAVALFRATSGGKMAVNVAFNFKVVDSDGDGKVSLAELLDYYEAYGGPALQALYAPPLLGNSAPLGDALFRRLDKNSDGKLSREELEAAPSLLELDRDEDELLSPQELAPQLFPAPNNAPDSRPLLRAGGRSAASARSPFTLATPGDKPPQGADVELIVRLGERAPDEAPLEILKPRQPRPGLSVTKSDDGSLFILVDKTLVELRRNEGRPAPVQGLRERTLAQFHAADAGGKGYVTARDARQAEFFADQFALLDRDGDGKLTEKELVSYLDEVQLRQAKAITCATAVLISEEGRGLFDLLDRNRDGKLGLRELRDARKLLALLGREKEEALTANDIPRTYQIALGMGEASFNRCGGRGVFTPRAMPLLSLDWSPPGMAWFLKMDRNHDGDISRREFLGTREQFERLDTDGDGLISLEEAERALARDKNK